MISVQLDRRIYRRLEQLATDNGLSINRLLERALKGHRVRRPKYPRPPEPIKVGSREHKAAVIAMARARGWTDQEIVECWTALTGTEGKQ